MRVPLSWLKDFVDIRLPVQELAEKLTFAGLEVEDIEYIGVPAPANARGRELGLAWDRDKIFVAQLVETLPHPNADRLKIVRVDYGHGEPVQMVTGAPNIAVGDSGQKVILGLEGSRVYDGHKEGRQLMTLKKSKIRGVESASMVLSEKELGLSDEHEGIVILPDDAPVGTPLADYWGDVVLDVKINPNFARAQSVLGVAREVAALTGQTVRLPAHWDTTERGVPDTDLVRIEIADSHLCPRFSALLIRNVKIAPSPSWMQQRLIRAGMRPINNVVDITNYVMLGYGKPLHAFDYDRLVERAGGKPTIIVRAARQGERMQTLDGQLREFQPHDILVTDVRGPVGIAGIMGGSETEVSDDTRNVLLESAIFDFISIRRTTQEQKLPSEAATRFGRGIPPSQNVAPARVAADLMHELAGGKVEPALADNYPVPQTEPTIRITTRDVRRILGIDLARGEMARILTQLDFRVETDADEGTLHVTPPDYRLDVDGTDDVLEEVVRIYGYDRIPSALIADALPPLNGNLELEQEETARDLLIDAGLQEIVTYVFTNPSHEAQLVTLPDWVPANGSSFDPLPARPYVELANPISEDRSALRQTLLPNMLDSAAANLRHTDRVALFEIGKVFLNRLPSESLPEELPEDVGIPLPLEPRRLAIVICGPRTEPTWQLTQASSSVNGSGDSGSLDFYDIKGVVEELVEGLHARGMKFTPVSHPMLHPGRAARLSLGDESVGIFGELHPVVAARWEFPPRPVLVGEFDLERLLALTDSRFIVKPISRYPVVVQDIALTVDSAVPAAEVEHLIRQTGGALLADARLFDVYRGEPLPPGKKSLAYTLTFQALDRVLSDGEAAKLRDKIVNRLKREVGAELRSG